MLTEASLPQLPPHVLTAEVAPILSVLETRNLRLKMMS